MRSPRSVVEHGLLRLNKARTGRLIFAGIEVAVEAWEIARRDFDANAMARLKDMTRRRPGVNSGESETPGNAPESSRRRDCVRSRRGEDRPVSR